MTEVPIKPDGISSLEQWLTWLEFLHPAEIELGLDRVRSVAAEAGLLDNLPPIVTVAGTNGKGSIVSLLSSVYREAGYVTGAYTSPHLRRFNERICVNGMEATDQEIVDALVLVELHRKDVPLTYFEFTTLAAMQIFTTRGVQVAVLEVGLGGRLDAVNIWDACCTILTSIALDHESWLGSTRQEIASEKIAVARPNTPLICAEVEPPGVVGTFSSQNDVLYWQVNRDYHYAVRDKVLQVRMADEILDLPVPGLAFKHQVGNAAAAVAAVRAIQTILPVGIDALRTGLQKAQLVGRFDIREIDGCDVILDVAHNPAAAKVLSASLSSQAKGRRIHAIFAIMEDKDIEGVVSEIYPQIHRWHLGDLEIDRAVSAKKLAARLTGVVPQPAISLYASVTEAFQAAIGLVDEPQDQLVLVFGSFFTVTDILEILDR